MSSGPDRDRASVAARALRAIGGLLVALPRPLAALLTIGWAGLIWFLSAQRPVVFAIASAWGGVLSNLAHAPEYAIFTAWVLLCAPRRDGWPVLSRRIVGWVLAVVVAYAAVDEIHQGLVPLRDASVFDVLTDLVGACVLLRIATIVGPRARTSPPQLLRTVVWGALACLVAACLASFVPPYFPELKWL